MIIRFFIRILLGRSNISAVIQLFQAEVLQRPRTCPNNAGCVQADLWHLPRFDNHARNQRRATYLIQKRWGEVVGWVGIYKMEKKQSRDAPQMIVTKFYIL